MGDFEAGDKVSWNYAGKQTNGKVVKKITNDTEINGHTVRASSSDPQYLVESDSGNRAAHKSGALTKRA